eukprot:TRINITY_DN29627_c0_g1_i2.p1 TRINITY_DN29627_c0_g1~~TRINITY_DN29627_c0_g1_i2.p1  ORF type:complete len:417 (+),score=95.46 TRINITY_DN29627_c0_g1_i2:62-1252(+)
MEPSRGGCDGDAVAAALESAAAVLPCLGPLAGELVQLRAQLGELRAEVAQLRGEAGSAAHDLHDWRAEELERLEQAATREKEAALRATEEMRLLLRSRDGDSAEGAAQAAPAAARDGEVGVRYFYKGQAPGRGKVIFCACPTGGLPATLVRARLCSAGLDLDRLAPYYYSERWQGYVALPTEEETIPLTSADPPLLDVQLEELPGLTERAMRSLRVDAPDGFFGIGIVRGKTESNHGLLWRTAYQLGASFTFSIGARYKQRGDGGSDTYRSAISCPQWDFGDFGDFAGVAPYGAPFVAVETGGTPLDAFEHPHRCVYLLGSEDNGLPSAILQACHAVITIPSLRGASYNVAVAGSLVMYDRLAKERRRQLQGHHQRRAGGGGPTAAKRGKAPGDCA